MKIILYDKTYKEIETPVQKVILPRFILSDEELGGEEVKGINLDDYTANTELPKDLSKFKIYKF